MKSSSKLLDDAVYSFSKLPGIGKKTALRTLLHLVQRDKALARNLIESLGALVDGIRECEKCHNLSDNTLCVICSERGRDNTTVCVVESIRDVMAIEDTNQYRGLYHVLGGVISPIDGIGPDDLYIDDLITRISRDEVKELIMAVSPTIEGETTIFYISKQLAGSDVKVSVLARGIAFGGELEYADELTLGRSIVARIPYQTHEQ